MSVGCGTGTCKGRRATMAIKTMITKAIVTAITQIVLINDGEAQRGGVGFVGNNQKISKREFEFTVPELTSTPYEYRYSTFESTCMFSVSQPIRGQQFHNSAASSKRTS